MAGNASGIRAGRAYVELGAYTAPLEKELERSGKLVQGWGKSLAVLGATLTAAGGAGIAFFGHAISQWVEGGTKLYELSKRTGASVEALSTLGHVAERNGSSVEELGMAFRKMNMLIDQADRGSQSAIDTLARLGTTAAELKGMTPDDKFRRLGAAVGGVADESAKGALAVAAFGRSGMNYLPIFADGADGLAKLEQRAKDLRLEMSGESAKAAHEFGNLWKDLNAVWKKSVSVIGAALAPELVSTIGHLTDLGVKVIDFLRANREMIILVAEGTVALVALGTAVTVVATGIIGLGFTISALGTIIGVAAAAFDTLLNPTFLLIALAGYLTAEWVGFATKTGPALQYLGGVFTALADTVLTAWGGVRDALEAGDFLLAAKVAWTGLKFAALANLADIQIAWVNFTSDLEAIWVTLQAKGEMFWARLRFNGMEAVAGLNIAWSGLAVTIANSFATTSAGFGALVSGMGDRWQRLTRFITDSNTFWVGALIADLENLAPLFGGAFAVALAKAKKDAGKAKAAPRFTDTQAEIAAADLAAKDKLKAELDAIEARRLERLQAIDDQAADAALQFQQAIAEANDAAKAARRRAALPPPQVWEAPDVEAMAKQFVSAGVRGTFNPFAAGALASADPAKETAANTKKANKHLEQIERELADLNQVGP